MRYVCIFLDYFWHPLDILRQKTRDVDMKKYAVQLLEKSESFLFTLHVLNRLEIDIKERIEQLGGNAVLLCLLDKLIIPSTDAQ